MGLIDLAEIAEVMTWQRENVEVEDHHPGVFVKIPRSIAQQFPKKEEDNSPPHISICLLQNISPNLEKKLVKVVQEVCTQFKPFPLKLGKVKKFVTDEKIVLYSSVKSGKLVRFHDALKQNLLSNQMPVDSAHPDFVPHITIGYGKDRKELKQYKEIQPQGEWILKDIWIWGASTPYLINLGK